MAAAVDKQPHTRGAHKYATENLVIVRVGEELERGLAAERDLRDDVHGAEKVGHLAHADLAVARAAKRVNFRHVNHAGGFGRAFEGKLASCGARRSASRYPAALARNLVRRGSTASSRALSL